MSKEIGFEGKSETLVPQLPGDVIGRWVHKF